MNSRLAGGISGHPRAGSSKKGGMQTYNRPEHGRTFRSFGLFNVPGIIAALASMLYGGRYGATAQDDYIGTAHHAFNSAVLALTQLWQVVATPLGLSGNTFVTSIAEFAAVVAALLFAIFAGIGGAIVYGIKLLIQS
jgi:hypothetical protein